MSGHGKPRQFDMAVSAENVNYHSSAFEQRGGGATRKRKAWAL